MADQIEVTVSIKLNGWEIAGFPYRRRILVDEAQQFSYEVATGGGYGTLPTTQIAALSLLALTADQAITARLDGQSDAGVALNAGGLLLLIDSNVDAGASTNATVDNSSGSTAVVKGLGAGT
jgi:hypothetical protein